MKTSKQFKNKATFIFVALVRIKSEEIKKMLSPNFQQYQKKRISF